MAVYSIRGFAAFLTAVAADEPICLLWNPASPPRRITLWEVGSFRAGLGGARPCVRWTTTRGTPGSTVTPTADNSWDDSDAPASSAAFDLGAFTSTLPAGEYLEGFGTTHAVTGQASGGGLVVTFPYGLIIPPGTGAGLVVSNAQGWGGGASGIGSECYAVWEED